MTRSKETRVVTITAEMTGSTLKVLSVMLKDEGQGLPTISNLAWVKYDFTRGIVHALHDLGLVAKEARRARAWVITDKGQAVLDQLKEQGVAP